MFIFQVSNSCVTAGVLIANILSDSSDLASDLSLGILFIFVISTNFSLYNDVLHKSGPFINLYEH